MLCIINDVFVNCTIVCTNMYEHLYHVNGLPKVVALYIDIIQSGGADFL